MSSNEDDKNTQAPVRLFDGELSRAEDNVYVSLTYDLLDSRVQLDRVKSPKAGAVVLFAGIRSVCPP